MLAAAVDAGAVERSCGPDARTNVTDVLCAPPSGPCTASLVRVSADITTASPTCRFDLENRALVVERTIESTGNLLFEHCDTLTVTTTGKVKARGDFRQPSDVVERGGRVELLCTGAIDHYGLLDVSGGPGGLVVIETRGDVVLASGSTIRADGISAALDDGERAGDGGELVLHAVDGAIAVQGDVSLRGQADGSGGSATLEAGRGCVFDTSVDASGGSLGGGDWSIEAGTDVTLRGAIVASSRGGGDSGGLILITAGVAGLGTITAEDAIFDVRGSSADQFGGSGGDVEMTAAGTIRLGPGTAVRVDAGTQHDGDAGGVFIEAGSADDDLDPDDGDLVFQGSISARGGNAVGTSGAFTIELLAGRNLLVAGPIVSRGSDFGGDIIAAAGGAITIAAPMSATASDADGTGGVIDVLGGLAADATLTVAADLDGSGGRAGDGDTILLGACAVRITAGTTIDGRGGIAPDGDLGGTDMTVIWQHTLEIEDDARLLAGPGGTIFLTHPPGTPGTIGSGVVFDPAPIDDQVAVVLGCDPPQCGNGVVEPGEACDDGNLDDTDACSSSCESQCPPGPAAGCRVLVSGASGRLLVRDESRDGRDGLQWKWTGGEATTHAALGDPISRDAYRLCLYDVSTEAPALLLSASAPAGGICAGRPCWRANRDHGFRYHDRARTPDGLDRLELRAGARGKAKMRVTGKGALLPLPPLPLPLPARVQLHGRAGECWETAFDGASTLQNDTRRFKARAILPTPGPTPTGPTPTPTRTPTATRTVTPSPTPDVSTLTRLELLPRQVAREMGKMVRFTAVGHLANGALVNLTQEVEYASSAPSVGVATNQPGDRSRVDTAAAGVAVISAAHLATGVTTTASGDDATVTVFGALERLTLAPASTTIVPGESLALTATGHYAGGGTLDLTHRVDYRSSAPAIVVAPNQAGAKSVVTGVAPGTATIAAVDPFTSVATVDGGGDATVEVVPLTRLVVMPAAASLEVFRTLSLAAIGHYADGSTRNLTARVTFVASDPATAAVDANRVTGLAPGTITVAAHDAATGITSTDSGDDSALEVVPIAALRVHPAAWSLRVGQTLSLLVFARFQDGSEIVLTADEATTTSDDPTVAVVERPGPHLRVRAVGPGVAAISATAGGVTSSASGGDLTLTVTP